MIARDDRSEDEGDEQGTCYHGTSETRSVSVKNLSLFVNNTLSISPRAPKTFRAPAL